MTPLPEIYKQIVDTVCYQRFSKKSARICRLHYAKFSGFIEVRDTCMDRKNNCIMYARKSILFLYMFLFYNILLKTEANSS